ncbi:MAG: D-arabinono-1,4-lactone oxidase [Thermomicrobiales bacterium]
MSENAEWTNWAGGVTCVPARLAMPESEAALVALFREAEHTGWEMRVAGSGHSFVPLCASNGVLLSLDGMQGVVETEPAAMQATIWAGTKIHQIGAPLLAVDMAMETMGDIDRQSLAGAIGTGTHGTGPTLGSIATQVVGLRLLTASGDYLDCSAEREPEIFAAARVSLGMLGIITRVTLRLLPAYRLHEHTWIASFDECMADLATLIAATRHFEFFWSPGDDACAMKALHPTDAEQWEQPEAEPDVQGRLARYVHPDRVDWSYRILPSERNIRFNEMEFAVPAAHGPDCLRESRQLMREKHPDVTWPGEYRTLHADDIPLSPAYGRETVTISIHQDATLPHHPFFTDAEAIFRNYHGRPHWGKMHWHSGRDLRDLYPLWDQFHTVRARMDPTGRFLNAYLREQLLAE